VCVFLPKGVFMSDSYSLYMNLYSPVTRGIVHVIGIRDCRLDLKLGLNMWICTQYPVPMPFGVGT
jgi:hypothetical protein